MGAWWNYKQAADLPPGSVERMWRALDRIAEGANPALKPGYAAYMNKADIVEAAMAALPKLEDEPRGGCVCDELLAELRHQRLIATTRENAARLDAAIARAEGR